MAEQVSEQAGSKSKQWGREWIIQIPTHSRLFTRFYFSAVKTLHFIKLLELQEMKQGKEPDPTLNIAG